MNDDPSMPAVSKPMPQKSNRGGRAVLLFLILLVFIAGFAAITFWPQIQNRLQPSAPVYRTDTAPAAPFVGRIAELQRKIDAVNARVDDITTRLDNMASPPPAAPSGDNNGGKNSADIARTQSDLVALSAAVSGLQGEMKQVSDLAATTRTQTQSSLAEALSFMQLREAAASGHSFASSLTALQTAAKNDSAASQFIEELAPYADKGVPTAVMLREQLAAVTGETEQAISKAEAQNWWQRVLAELKGLVSIRSVHDASSPNDVLAMMQNDLLHDDLAAALDRMKNLPAEAQKTLEDWNAQAEARLKIDQALRAIADHLAIPAPAATPAQETP